LVEVEVRLLLDSHILVWWATGQLDRLPPSVSEAIGAAEDIFVSVATAWELEIKRNAGRFDAGSLDWAAPPSHGITLLPIELEDALAAAGLPLIHRDPFDRMIVAQAMRRRLTLVSADAALADYGVAILKA
jgi:PIN domain nuclease of toxin-antitoxin system